MFNEADQPVVRGMVLNTRVHRLLLSCCQIVQPAGHVLLDGREEMCIAISNVNGFMAHPISDCDSTVSHINKKRDV